MDFHLRKHALLERAKRVEEKAWREKNAQAQDLLRALAALYRDMAEELDDSGLFERRFRPLDIADFPNCEAEPFTGAGEATTSGRFSLRLQSGGFWC